MEADLVGAGRIGVGSDRREVVGGFNQPFHYVRGLETRQLDTSVWRNPALNVERLHEHAVCRTTSRQEDGKARP